MTTRIPTPFKPLTPPLPEAIRAARQSVDLTQAQAAAVVHSPSYRTWQDWELGKTPMPIGLWELFLLKTGQVELRHILESELLQENLPMRRKRA